MDRYGRHCGRVSQWHFCNSKVVDAYNAGPTTVQEIATLVLNLVKCSQLSDEDAVLLLQTAHPDLIFPLDGQGFTGL